MGRDNPMAGRFGTVGAVNTAHNRLAPVGTYNRAFDRGDNNKLVPDGTISLGNVLAIARQFQHTCALPPDFPIQFSYDAENRLVSRPGVSYVYDGQGTLVKKTEGGTTTVYVAGLYENAGGAVTKYYVFNGERVAMRTSSGVSYLLQDHLGSTTATVGATSSSQKYYPFGSQRSMNPVSTDKRFTGHQQSVLVPTVFASEM